MKIIPGIVSSKEIKFAVTLFFVLVYAGAGSQSILPRSSPEAEGVSSESIIQFLDAATESKNEMHSIMFLRHGKVIAEGWWKPYGPDLKHTMYSVSKSFTSTAVGFAVNEQRLSVDDKVVSFFPDYLPDTISTFLSALTVRDLLSMTVGHDPDPTSYVLRSDSNWIRSFLALPVVNNPGTKFLYNTLATYMLSAIVQKVTGEKLIDYLAPRLFSPLGITGMDWETDPMGINTGGWGLRIKTEDMARFGQLYLQKGKWNGKQLLPEAWIGEATTMKIDQAPGMPQEKKDSSDWTQGYCYQFWRSRHNSYRADGAFGQFILILPEQDAVIVLTAETQDMQDELNMVWKYLLPAMHQNKLPADNKMLALLKQKLASLAHPPPVSTVTRIPRFSVRTYTIEPNERKLETISFRFEGNNCHLTLKTDTAAYKFVSGSGIWYRGVTTMRGPSLTARAKAHFVGLAPPKIFSSYRWKNENALELVLRYIESPHTLTITCQFDGNNISVEFQDSFDRNPANKTPPLKGVLMK